MKNMNLRLLGLAAIATVIFTKSLIANSPATAPAVHPTATELQDEVIAVAPKCVAATVGIICKSTDPNRHTFSSSSGVIVSADGLLMTAGHVIEEPANPLTIRLSGGRVVHGVALGLDRATDTGLARITDPVPSGGWLFAAIAPDDSARVGEWVLATGHPGRVVQDRNPPLRLGRVTRHDAEILATNCSLEPGDSGGPLFDLKGRVVGISSRFQIDGDLQEHHKEFLSIHVPVSQFTLAWKDLLSCENAHPDVVLGLRSGQEPTTQPSADSTPPPASANISAPVSREALAAGKTSLQTLAFFSSSIDMAGSCVVEIRAAGQPVLLGTIVESGGYIVTKASDLPARPTVVLPDGRTKFARVVGQDSATDLALLKIEASGLTSAKFSGDAATLGELISAPTTDPSQPAIGVISEVARPIPEKFGFFAGEVELDPVPGKPKATTQQFTYGIGEADRTAGGKLSRRRASFPMALQTDADVWADQCGGPLIDLKGQVVGVTIARYDRACTFVIPADLVQKTVARLKPR